jgi:hypothetical protein
MLTNTCCDPAIQAAISDVQGGNYSGSPRLQTRLIADYQNRNNWSYNPATNACTWTQPMGAFYTLDSGDPAGVASPQSVDAAHYGGGCIAGGFPNPPTPSPAPAPSPAAAPSSNVVPYLLLAAVGAGLIWFVSR